MLLLALAAYSGGFLPGHYLRRTDRLIIHANSRNEDSRWREVIEGVTLSLSDQQLVTGIAILVAGYYDMMNNDMAVYHWQIIVYLAWLSSSVHIASLTLLKDVLNKHQRLRNIRVAGMLALLVLLLIATWPLSRLRVGQSKVMATAVPVKCLWDQRPWDHHYERNHRSSLDPDWVYSTVTLLGAYFWKLSQLFTSSRGCLRGWAIARPQAATERLMRRMLMSSRSRQLVWPAYEAVKWCYAVLVVCTESAESFIASIIYLCYSVLWGVANIFRHRAKAPEVVKVGETGVTFGQLVPLFLLILPVLLVFELSAGEYLPVHVKPGESSLTVVDKGRTILVRGSAPSSHLWQETFADRSARHTKICPQHCA